MPGRFGEYGARPPRKLPPRPWVPRVRTVTPPPTAEAVLYAQIHTAHPFAALGYGITRGGPWARVGDQRVRGRTPEAALRLALAQHVAAS